MKKKTDEDMETLLRKLLSKKEFETLMRIVRSRGKHNP